MGAEAHRRYLEEQMLDLQVHNQQDILDRDLHGNKQEKDSMCGMRCPRCDRTDNSLLKENLHDRESAI